MWKTNPISCVNGELDSFLWKACVRGVIDRKLETFISSFPRVEWWGMNSWRRVSICVIGSGGMLPIPRLLGNTIRIGGKEEKRQRQFSLLFKN